MSEISESISESIFHFFVVFFRCGCVAESMECFEKAGDWQMTFALSAQLGHDRGQRSQLARRMAGERERMKLSVFLWGCYYCRFCAVALKSERRYLAAATVLTDYAEVVCVSVSVCLCV